MAGLLSPEDASLMALGTGLLGGGTFAQAFGRGGQAALSTYAAMAQAQQEKALKERELAMQEELKKAQIANYLSEAKTRDQNLEVDKSLIAFLSGGRPNAPAAAPVDGVGPMQSQAPLQIGVPPVGGLIAADSGQGGPISQMTPEQLAMFKLRGKDLTDIHKMTRPDWQVSNGYRWDKNAPGNSTGFMPSASTSSNGQTTMLVPDGKGGMRVVMPNGAGEAFSDYQNREQEAKAKYETVTIPGPDGKPQTMLKSQAAEYLMRTQPTSNGLPAPTGSRDEYERLAWSQKGATPEIVRQVMESFDRQRSQTPGMPGVTGQSEADKAKSLAEARLPSDVKALTNKDFMERAFPAVQQAGESASTVLESTNIARDAMRRMGSTGWGTETKAAFANVLTSLGVAPGNAQMYAASAEIFQNQAMQRIQAELAQQKGVQAKDDAERASKTFAQLKNTPQANEFILDYMQARAERDRIKASFYRDALPIAREKDSDLAAVEREWSRLAPKLFDLPSMKRWVK